MLKSQRRNSSLKRIAIRNMGSYYLYTAHPQCISVSSGFASVLPNITTLTQAATLELNL